MANKSSKRSYHIALKSSTLNKLSKMIIYVLIISLITGTGIFFYKKILKK